MNVLKQNNHTVLCRNVNIHQPLECEKAANQLYSRYFGIFERANSIIKERGRSPLDTPDRLFPEKLAVPDASGSDEDWDSSFEIVLTRSGTPSKHPAT